MKRKRKPLDCEHNVLASACPQCKHTVRVANHNSTDGWTALIRTKYIQFASLEEMHLAEGKGDS